MSHFDKAIIDILRHEGGLVDHPSDPGGLTNRGISKRAYPRLSDDYIRNLTVEQATELYRRDYWLKQYDQLQYPVAAKVFDMSVNMGKAQSHKILQRAVGAFADGIIGPQTISKTNDLPVELVLNNITNEQKKVYAAIVNNRPTSSVFMAGWNKRAEWHPIA